MANSGSKTVVVTSWNSLVFSWSVSSQSIANNTSTVTWALNLVSTSDGTIASTAQKSWIVTVDGNRYEGTNTVGIAANSTKTLASGTTVIKHNDDGKLQLHFHLLIPRNYPIEPDDLHKMLSGRMHESSPEVELVIEFINSYV